MTIAGITLALAIIGYAGLELARAALASPWRRG